MALAGQTDIEDGPEEPGIADELQSSSSERRRFGRQDIENVSFRGDNGTCAVLNISLGGMLLRGSEDLPEVDEIVQGELRFDARRNRLRCDLSARVIRQIASRNLIAAEFSDLGPEAMDVLLEILTAVEQARVEAARLAYRRAAFRSRLKTVLKGGGILLAVLAVLGFIITVL